MRCPYWGSVSWSFFTTITQKMMHWSKVWWFSFFMHSPKPSPREGWRHSQNVKKFLSHDYLITLIIWWSWREICWVKSMWLSRFAIFFIQKQPVSNNAHFHLTMHYLSQISFTLRINPWYIVIRTRFTDRRVSLIEFWIPYAVGPD